MKDFAQAHPHIEPEPRWTQNPDHRARHPLSLTQPSLTGTLETQIKEIYRGPNPQRGLKQICSTRRVRENHFKNSLLNLLLFLFYVLGFWLQDLSSPIRGQTQTPYTGRQNLNQQTATEAPSLHFKSRLARTVDSSTVTLMPLHRSSPFLFPGWNV